MVLTLAESTAGNICNFIWAIPHWTKEDIRRFVQEALDEQYSLYGFHEDSDWLEEDDPACL